jgi:hypothetical protein
MNAGITSAPRDQRLVVSGDMLVRGRQAIRILGYHVVRLQPARLGVHQRHRPAERAGGLRQGHGGVVRGDQQQRLEQAGHLIGAAELQADHVRLDRGGPPGGDHRGVRVQQRDQRYRREHLQRARGRVLAVRVLGRQHLPGGRIRDDVGGGGHPRQRPPGSRRVVHDDPAAGQVRPADRPLPGRPAGRRAAATGLAAGTRLARGGLAGGPGRVIEQGRHYLARPQHDRRDDHHARCDDKHDRDPAGT